MRRRSFLPTLAGAGLVPAALQAQSKIQRKGRIKQSVCPGVFRGSGLELEDMAREIARLGATGFDHQGPDAFPILKKYGLVPTMVGGGSSVRRGINRKGNHGGIERRMRPIIQACHEAGAPNIIVLSGGRNGMSDEQGADNSVLFLNKVKSMAEDLGVTLCIELLNSKINHPGYMADSTAWGVEVCERVNSPRVKLLYDIYHMQVMEGDIIRTIQDNIDYIAHFHTAGNPGRHEFDDTQELNYVGICKAIVDTGFQGYVGQEYTTDKDHVAALDRMITICDV